MNKEQKDSKCKSCKFRELMARIFDIHIWWSDCWYDKCDISEVEGK